jgi:hypothetical protein
MVALVALAAGGTLVARNLGRESAVTTRHVYEGDSIAAAIAASEPGARVVVHEGTYPRQHVARAFSSPVTVRAAAGEKVQVAGFHFSRPARNVVLHGFAITAGQRDDGVLFTDGTRNITVSRARIVGGRFGVRFSAGAFAGWPRDIRIEESEIAGAYEDNVRISGARDVTLEHNWIHDPRVNGKHNDGVQAIASNGLSVRRNTFSFTVPGPAGPNQAIILGHADPSRPGRKVVRTDVVNNLIYRWQGVGITLAGTASTRIANNTVYDSGAFGRDITLLLSAKRNPAQFANTDVRLANNIIERMEVTDGAVRPRVETHNLVRVGGGGSALVTHDPLFANGTRYRIGPASPAVDTATRAYAARVDLNLVRRDGRPDRGAIEVG